LFEACGRPETLFFGTDKNSGANAACKVGAVALSLDSSSYAGSLSETFVSNVDVAGVKPLAFEAPVLWVILDRLPLDVLSSLVLSPCDRWVKTGRGILVLLVG